MRQHNGTGTLGYGMMTAMNRRALILIVTATAVLAWVSLFFVGDTGVDPPEPRPTETVPAPPSVAVAPARNPVDTPPVKPLKVPTEPTRTLQPSPRIKTPQRTTSASRGGVFDGSQLRGVASAMMLQAPSIQDCYRDWSDEHGELPGRFTLQVTVPAGGEDLVPAEAVLPFVWPEGEDLEDCVADVLQDTRFTPPGDRDFQIMWPVPQVQEAGME